MAEELKQEEKKCTEGKRAVSAFLKVLIGLAFLVLGVLAILKWLPQLLALVQGSIGLFLILAGIITLAIAKE